MHKMEENHEKIRRGCTYGQKFSNRHDVAIFSLEQVKQNFVGISQLAPVLTAIKK